MSWEDILKGRAVDLDLDELFEEYSAKKKEIDEWYEKEFAKLKQRMTRAEKEGGASSRNLRRKHPVTRRKRRPVELSPEEREGASMPDPRKHKEASIREFEEL